MLPCPRPAYGYPDDDDDVLPRPGFVLIEEYAYLADRDNATTGADGTAGEKEKKARLPSLPHIPSPNRNYTIGESSVTLLRRCINHRFDAANRRHGDGQEDDDEDHDCETCGYVLAAMWSSFARSRPHQICLYQSDKPYYGYGANKSIGIGGDDGVVAWVDLKRGIVLCDALAESPRVRLVGLPPLMPPFEGVSNGGNARYGRGVAMVDGSLRYTQLECRIVPGSYEDDGSVIFDGWRAATWSWKIATDVTGGSSLPLRATWRMDYQLDSSECSSSLPEVLVAGQNIASERLHIGLPVPSLREDGVVYYLGKIDYRDSQHTACVVAVDMRNKTIRGTAEFGAKMTVGLGYGYVSSTISKYLRVASPRM